MQRMAVPLRRRLERRASPQRLVISHVSQDAFNSVNDPAQPEQSANGKDDFPDERTESLAAEQTTPDPPQTAPDEPDSDLPEREPLTPELVEDEALRGDFMMRWATVLLALLLGFTAIDETQTLLHVKSGQYTLEHFLPARTGVFSATAAERPWTNLSWLFDVLLAAVYGIGAKLPWGSGDAALSVFKALIAATTFGILVHTNRKDVSTWWGTVCAGLALLACYRQFTALPENVTLLGLALTLWMLHRWREDGETKFLKGLVVLFLVWANLDPRMFLGLAILVLYALGETAGEWLGFPALPDQKRRIQLWKTVGLCVLVTFVNPFLWNAPLEAVSLYGVEYPAMQSFHLALHGFRDLQYFPLLEERFWDWGLHDPGAMAALLLFLTAAVSFALNFRRVELGDVVVWLAFVGFSVAAAHELAAAALVSAVMATLNAQQWYQHTFRQTYSVETSELAFSRGGRAVTVLALFGIAYLAISGISVLDFRLERRVGIGFDADLQASIDGMRRDLADSFDDRPFNFVLSQGDVLVWIDKKPFIDSRIGLYAGEGDEDLVALHLQTRNSLRESTREGAAGRRWQTTLNRFKITHVAPRLDSRLTDSFPDYNTFRRLMRSPNWKLTRVGATVAVFYRADPADPKLAEYVRSHTADFIEAAFHEAWDAPPARAEWARGPTWFETWLNRPKRHTSNAALASSHYRQFILDTQQGVFSPALMSTKEGFDPLGLAASFAHLAIRRANEALAADPQNAEAYRNLGMAYEQLALIEASQYFGSPLQSWEQNFTGEQQMQVLRARLQLPMAERRYRQAVSALHQALVLDPDDVGTLRLLADLFQLYGCHDLQLRTLRRANELTREHGGPFSEEETKVNEAYEAIEKAVAARNDLEQFLDDLQQKREAIPEGEEGVRQRLALVQRALMGDRRQIRLKDGSFAMQVVGGNCIGAAIDILEDDPTLKEGNSRIAVKWIDLLQWAGRFEEADADLSALSERDKQVLSLDRFRTLNAYQALARADYATAAQIWREQAERLYQLRIDDLAASMPLMVRNEAAFDPDQRNRPNFWMYDHAESLQRALVQAPAVAADYYVEAALTELEAGNNDVASALFRRAVEIAPRGGSRPVARFYLHLLTGTWIEWFPSDRSRPVEAPRPRRARGDDRVRG